MVKKLPGAERSLSYYPACVAEVCVQFIRSIDTERARGQKMYNKSLKGAWENSNRLQITYEPVNIIKKKKKKWGRGVKGCKNSLNSTFMHL